MSEVGLVGWSGRYWIVGHFGGSKKLKCALTPSRNIPVNTNRGSQEWRNRRLYYFVTLFIFNFYSLFIKMNSTILFVFWANIPIIYYITHIIPLSVRHFCLLLLLFHIFYPKCQFTIELLQQMHNIDTILVRMEKTFLVTWTFPRYTPMSNLLRE